MLAEAATILLVDDDPLIVRSVSFLLRQEGYRVVSAASGAEALAAAREAPPDVVLLDVALPDLGGVEICRRLRQETGVPIIILSARRAEADKIVGLDAGADDYLTKPIGAGELAARVRAALRRGRAATLAPPPSDRLVGVREVVGLVRRPRGSAVALDSGPMLALLHLLVAHAGRTLERQFIFERVWGQHFFGDQSALDVYVRQLRRKIERDPGRPVLLETVRGVGYRFANVAP